MTELARQRLRETIEKYGSSICNMPQSCAMVLRENCHDCRQDADRFIQALEQGYVTEILAPTMNSWDSLSGPLVEQFREAAGVSREEARWVLDSWAMALGRHLEAPVRATSNPEPAALPEQPAHQHLFPEIPAPALINAAGGMLGALLLGILFTSLVASFEITMTDRTRYGNKTIPHPRLGRSAKQLPPAEAIAPWTVIVGTLVAMLLAALGGALGWICVHGLGANGSQATAHPNVIGGLVGTLGGTMILMILGTLFLGALGFYGGAAIGGFTGAVTGEMKGRYER